MRRDNQKSADVGGLADAGCAEVGIDRLAAIVDQDPTLSRTNRSDYCGNPTVREGASLRSTEGTLPNGRVSDKPLAVCRRAKVVTVLCVATDVLQSISSNGDRQSLQSLRLIFHGPFRAHDAEHVMFERELF